MSLGHTCFPRSFSSWGMGTPCASSSDFASVVGWLSGVAVGCGAVAVVEAGVAAGSSAMDGCSLCPLTAPLVVRPFCSAPEVASVASLSLKNLDCRRKEFAPELIFLNSGLGMMVVRWRS